MHRVDLLSALEVYSPVDRDEREMVGATSQFVKQQARCFERSLGIGHVTGSAWVVDLERNHTLLTHHRKLERWFQPGGHADGDADILRVALKEAREETGLADVRPVVETIFDVDVHSIPSNAREPCHLHYDIRFLLEADRSWPLVMSAESRDLAWVPFDRVPQYSNDASILRMLKKALA
ncbi:MAG: NUDIX hydrolase [Gammaproteobacteria bacterium]|nr:NUDIX hydrolase [Gammaproteobacteria bacterium]